MPLSPEEREERDRQRAEIAFWDYYHMGPGRSLAELFRRYVKIAREEGVEKVPTRHKPKLSEWKSKYRWEERIIELDAKEIESKRRDYQLIRRLTRDALVDLNLQAVATLKTLLVDPEVKPNVRLETAKAILDRTGHSPRAALPNREASESTTTSLPSPDAEPEKLLEWYATYKKG